MMPQQAERADDSLEDWGWLLITKAQESRGVGGAWGWNDAHAVRFAIFAVEVG